MEVGEVTVDPTASSPARTAAEAILRVASLLDGLVAEIAARSGLSSIELRLLREVRDPVPQHALAERLSCDPARITQLTADLERRGFLTRRVDRSDRRVRRSRLTPTGRAIVEAAGNELADRSPIVHGLTEDEQRQLAEVLERVELAARERWAPS